MIKEKIAKISTGDVCLKKPNAGARNKALVAAEFPTTESQSGSFVKWSVFWPELLPHSIVMDKSPGLENTVPLDQQLIGMNSKDYDLLQTELKLLYKDEEEMREQIKGESTEPSNEKSSQKTGGSVTNL